jgi:hypothetical protein
VPEQTKLKIIWKGNVPGLAEHRLSLGAFGEPLSCILTALRRIASARVSEAIGRRPAEVGRFPELARQLDVEIASIAEGSGGIEGIIAIQTPPGETMPMFNDLAELSGTELIDSIVSESRGNLRNQYVRDYLKKLHPGVTEHSYTLDRNGTTLRNVTIGSVVLATEMFTLPYLFELTGRIVGVGFSPGRNQITVMHEESRTFTATANQKQVDEALEWRDHPVRLLLLEGDPPKLLRLQLQSDLRVRLDVERYVYERWDGLLRRLAQ